MKSPTQLAMDAVNSVRAARLESTRTVALIMTVATKAIEADRAQRPTLDLAEFDQVTDAMGALVRGLERGREYVTIQDAQAAEELLRSKFGPALHDDWND